MRLPLLMLSCLLLLVRATSAEDPLPPDRASLTVEVTGFENDKGSLELALHSSPSSFLSKDAAQKPLRHLTLPIRDRKSSKLIEGLPPGEYAITVFHDENANQKLDTNFLGIPKEAVGFSGSTRPTFGPPRYDQARFTLKAGANQLSIQIKKIF